MIYYVILALIDIGLFFKDNWKELTFTAVASGVGVILGKRLGIRIAVDYFMKTFGLYQQSSIELQVAHHEQQIIKQGGTPWIAPISKPYRVNIHQLLSKRSILSRMAQSIARYTKLHMRWRKRRMKSFLTGKKKWLAFLIAVAVNGLNETLGLGISTDTVNNITQGATGYIVVEGALDFIRALTDYFKSKGAKQGEPTPTISTSEFEG